MRSTSVVNLSALAGFRARPGCSTLVQISEPNVVPAVFITPVTFHQRSPRLERVADREPLLARVLAERAGRALADHALEVRPVRRGRADFHPGA